MNNNQASIESFHRSLFTIPWAIAFFLPILLMSPGFSGPFLLDDFTNLVLQPDFYPTQWNWDTLMSAASSNAAGPTGRPLAMASFAVNTIFAGMNPFWMKATNAVIHCLNSLLLWLLTWKLTKWERFIATSGRARATFATAVAVSWAAHPVAITSSLYVIQRMNLMATTFVLLALLLYLHGRETGGNRIKQNRFHAFMTGSVVAGTVGIFCKENAAIFPLLLLITEHFVCRYRCGPGAPPVDHIRAKAFAAGVFLVLAGLLCLIIFLPDMLAGYSQRAFTLSERLLSEPRAIWQYMHMTILPSSGNLGLYLDDFPVSRSLAEPVTTLAAVGALVLLTAFALLSATRQALFSFGILFFLAGHMIEGTFIPLELMFEHRTYLPSIGLLLSVHFLVFKLLRKHRSLRQAWIPVIAGVVLVFSVHTISRAAAWSDSVSLAQYELRGHPSSPRANMMMGIELARRATDSNSDPRDGVTSKLANEAATFFQTSSDLAPGDPAPMLMLRRLSAMSRIPWTDDRQVRLVSALRSGLSSRAVPLLLHQLVTCNQQGRCSISESSLTELIESSLENNAYQGALRVELLMVGKYFAEAIVYKPSLALRYAREATKIEPGNPRFWIMTADCELRLGEPEEASRSLRKALATDPGNEFSADLESLKHRVRTALTKNAEAD